MLVLEHRISGCMSALVGAGSGIAGSGKRVPVALYAGELLQRPSLIGPFWGWAPVLLLSVALDMALGSSS